MDFEGYDVMHDISKAARQAISIGAPALISVAAFAQTCSGLNEFTIAGGITVGAVVTAIYRALKYGNGGYK